MGKSGRFVVLQVGIISVMLLGLSLCVHGLAFSVPTYVVLCRLLRLRITKRKSGSGQDSRRVLREIPAPVLGGFGPSSALVANDTVAGSGG